jgi:hypothetical protein
MTYHFGADSPEPEVTVVDGRARIGAATTFRPGRLEPKNGIKEEWHGLRDLENMLGDPFCEPLVRQRCRGTSTWKLANQLWNNSAVDLAKSTASAPPPV